MIVRRSLLGMAVSLALAAGLPQVASAQVAGEPEGVTAGRGRHDIVLRFSKRAAAVYRQIAGRRVIVGCGTVTRSFGGYASDGEGFTVVRAPRRRGTLHTYIRGGHADYCFVRLRTPHERLVAMAPVTRAGRIYLDELRTVGLMFVPFGVATDDQDSRPPTTEQAIADGHGLVVALDGPDGVPPQGRVGYWTDGTRMVVAALTERGRRLFFELEGDVVRTNVLGYLQE
jgi:hypothetical protein